jgi:uncharacterized protein (TIGR01244 family)
MLRRIDERMLVSGQIRPEDVPLAAAAGVTLIVNNRPEGEAADQPTGAEIEAAARAAGLGYRFIPVSGGFTPESIDAMATALADAAGPVLAYCTSGTRSTYLWAMARAQAGDDPDAIVAKAAAAGYDLTPLRPHLGP